MGQLLVIGGGGHAGVVLDALRSAGNPNLLDNAAIIDANPDLIAQGVAHGLPVAGSDDFLERAVKQGFKSFVLGFGGGINNQKRSDLFNRATAAGLEAHPVIHATATISGSASLGDGSVCFAGSIVNAHSSLGQNVILNTAAVVEHDCHVGDHVHIAPRACLLGGVTVKDLAFVGAGAVIRQGVTIGRGAAVGCGAVVLKDVPEGATVYGNPAILSTIAGS